MSMLRLGTTFALLVSSADFRRPASGREEHALVASREKELGWSLDQATAPDIHEQGLRSLVSVIMSCW